MRFIFSHLTETNRRNSTNVINIRMYASVCYYYFHVLRWNLLHALIKTTMSESWALYRESSKCIFIKSATKEIFSSKHYSASIHKWYIHRRREYQRSDRMQHDRPYLICGPPHLFIRYNEGNIPRTCCGRTLTVLLFVKECLNYFMKTQTGIVNKLTVCKFVVFLVTRYWSHFTVDSQRLRTFRSVLMLMTSLIANAFWR